jgi:adenylyltransferase/sulfurtransferase
LPKAIAAARRLRAINSQVTVEPVVADVTFENIASLAEGVGVIVDGTDNFETRMLVNDFAVKHDLPWVYGGVIGAEGQTMTILPGETACLACLMPELPPPGTTPTCDTAGVLGPVVNVIGSLEAMEAIKILAGRREAVSRQHTIVELWHNRVRHIDLAKLRDENVGDGSGCRCCQRGEFPWLDGSQGSMSAVLCGRNAVQISGGPENAVSLERLADKLASVGSVTRNEFLLRLAVDDYVLTVFADGRTIVAGTDDIATARTLVAKFVGS